MGRIRTILFISLLANKEIEANNANKRKKKLEMTPRMFLFCIFAIT